MARPVQDRSDQLAGLTVPQQGSSYPLALTAAGADPTSWGTRGIAVVGVLLALAGFSLVVPTVNWVVLSLTHAWFGAGEPMSQYQGRAVRFEMVSGMVAAHLGLGSLTLVVIGVLRLVHRRRAGWLWSVSATVRWRYGLVVLLASMVILNGVLLASTGAPQLRPQPGAWLWLVAVLLTAPVQALGEEALFRGYLLQALGMAVRSPVLAIVLSAAVFTVFHGVHQSYALMLQRFSFGVLAGALVWRTGGLEAAVAAHVANNLGAFTWAVLTSSVAQVRATQEISWAGLGRELAGFALVTAMAWWVARRMRVPQRV